MSQILFDIDTQKDFMNKDGKAYIADAEKSIHNINECIKHALRNHIVVAGTAVFKEGGDDYAVYETDGINKIPETRLVDEEFYYNVPITRHGIDIPLAGGCWQIYFEKEENNIWDALTGQPDNVMSYLRSENIKDIVIVGANHNSSVEMAIYGFLKNAFNVTVVTDAIAGSNDDITKISSVTYVTTEEFIN